APNAEFVHVALLPAHRRLQHVVQLRQRQVCGHQQPAPDRRARAKQKDPKRRDFPWGGPGFFCHRDSLNFNPRLAAVPCCAPVDKGRYLGPVARESCAPGPCGRVRRFARHESSSLPGSKSHGIASRPPRFPATPVGSRSDAPNRSEVGAHSAPESCSPVPSHEPKAAPRTDYGSRSTVDCALFAPPPSRSTHPGPPSSRRAKTTTSRRARILPSASIAPDNANSPPPGHGSPKSGRVRSAPSTTDFPLGSRPAATGAVPTLSRFLPLWLAAHWFHSAGSGEARAVLSFAPAVASASPHRADAPATVGIPGLSVVRWRASTSTAHIRCTPFL